MKLNSSRNPPNDNRKVFTLNCNGFVGILYFDKIWLSAYDNQRIYGNDFYWVELSNQPECNKREE